MFPSPILVTFPSSPQAIGANQNTNEIPLFYNKGVITQRKDKTIIALRFDIAMLHTYSFVLIRHSSPAEYRNKEHSILLGEGCSSV